MIKVILLIPQKRRTQQFIKSRSKVFPYTKERGGVSPTGGGLRLDKKLIYF